MPKKGGYGKGDLRRWQVVMKDGSKHEIEAHFAFDNTGEGAGLIFRAYDHRNDEHTYVVASFNRDSWSHYMEIK